MQLVNVTDDVVRFILGTDHETIVSPVLEPVLDVCSIVALTDAIVDPTLQKDIDLMNTWMAKAVVDDAPFTPVISKSQKKKMKPDPRVLFRNLNEFYFLEYSDS